eukprot:30896-Pelagococcus_subviridis.AAC.7
MELAYAASRAATEENVRGGSVFPPSPRSTLREQRVPRDIRRRDERNHRLRDQVRGRQRRHRRRLLAQRGDDLRLRVRVVALPDALPVGVHLDAGGLRESPRRRRIRQRRARRHVKRRELVVVPRRVRAVRTVRGVPDRRLDRLGECAQRRESGGSNRARGDAALLVDWNPVEPAREADDRLDRGRLILQQRLDRQVRDDRLAHLRQRGEQRGRVRRVRQLDAEFKHPGLEELATLRRGVDERRRLETDFAVDQRLNRSLAARGVLWDVVGGGAAVLARDAPVGRRQSRVAQKRVARLVRQRRRRVAFEVRGVGGAHGRAHGRGLGGVARGRVFVVVFVVFFFFFVLLVRRRRRRGGGGGGGGVGLRLLCRILRGRLQRGVHVRGFHRLHQRVDLRSDVLAAVDEETRGAGRARERRNEGWDESEGRANERTRRARAPVVRELGEEPHRAEAAERLHRDGSLRDDPREHRDGLRLAHPGVREVEHLEHRAQGRLVHGDVVEGQELVLELELQRLQRADADVEDIVPELLRELVQAEPDALGGGRRRHRVRARARDLSRLSPFSRLLVENDDGEAVDVGRAVRTHARARRIARRSATTARPLARATRATRCPARWRPSARVRASVGAGRCRGGGRGSNSNCFALEPTT